MDLPKAEVNAEPTAQHCVDGRVRHRFGLIRKEAWARERRDIPDLDSYLEEARARGVEAMLEDYGLHLFRLQTSVKDFKERPTAPRPREPRRGRGHASLP